DVLALTNQGFPPYGHYGGQSHAGSGPFDQASPREALCKPERRVPQHMGTASTRTRGGFRSIDDTYQWQKDVTDDLRDPFLGYGPEGGEQLVAKEVGRQASDARCELGRVDLAARHAAVQHLLDAERLALVAEKLRAEVGHCGARLREVLAH